MGRSNVAGYDHAAYDIADSNWIPVPPPQDETCYKLTKSPSDNCFGGLVEPSKWGTPWLLRGDDTDLPAQVYEGAIEVLAGDRLRVPCAPDAVDA